MLLVKEKHVVSITNASAEEVDTLMSFIFIYAGNKNHTNVFGHLVYETPDSVQHYHELHSTNMLSSSSNHLHCPSSIHNNTVLISRIKSI